MRTILFKKQFIEQIQRQEKIQTIRNWKSCSLKSDDILCCNFKKPFIQIDSVKEKTLKDLSVEEIKKDGFQSLKTFQEIWIDCYHSYNPEQKVFIISFHLYTPNL